MHAKAKFHRVWENCKSRGKVQKKARRNTLSTIKGKGTMIDPSDRARLVGTINPEPDSRSSEGQNLDCEGETTQGSQSLDAPYRDEDESEILSYDEAKGLTPNSAEDSLTNGPDGKMMEYEGEYHGDDANEAKEEDEDEDEDDEEEEEDATEYEEGEEEGEEEETDAEHEEVEEDEDQNDMSKPKENLLTLPRELRDEILKILVKVDFMSDSEFRVTCHNRPCNTRTRTDHSSTRQQFARVCEILSTCRQIHNEGTRVFFKINTWTLHRARLSADGLFDAEAFRQDTHRMFTSFYPQAPLAIVDAPRRTDCAQFPGPWNPHSVYHPTVIQRHSLDEETQSHMFQEALNCFADCHNLHSPFQMLRSFTLNIGYHILALSAASLQDRCGFVLKVKIVFQNMIAEEKKHFVEQADPNRKEGVIDMLGLEPRRRMLAPLVRLLGVQEVEVYRRWTVRYRKRDAKEVIITRPMYQSAKYPNVGAFLLQAGYDYGKFQVTGLEHFKIPEQDVVEIVEDETSGGPHEAVPVASSPLPLRGNYR